MLLIRVDAGVKIGAGHMMRCIALGQTWQERGGDVTFLSNCESEVLRRCIIDEGFNLISIDKPHPDPYDLEQTLQVLKRHAPCSMPYATTSHWLVVDGYHFTPDYQKAIRKTGYKLLVIDDMAHLEHYHVDLLINQNIHASSLQYSCDRDTVKLLGCEYVLLRREFLRYKDWKREIPDKARNILVTMGGADPDNVTLKIIKALNSLNDPNLEVKIVVGPANPYGPELRDAVRHAPCPMHCVENANNMAEIMVWADLAVSAGGSTCWEMAFMGLPTIILTLADNQQHSAQMLMKKMGFLCLGYGSDVKTNHLVNTLLSLLSKRKMRQEMNKKGFQLVDGLGRDRVMEVLLGIVVLQTANARKS